MAIPGIVPDSRMGRKPQVKKISMRSAVQHIAGQESSYPTYRFSGKIFVERPQHNPFKGL